MTTHLVRLSAIVSSLSIVGPAHGAGGPAEPCPPLSEPAPAQESAEYPAWLERRGQAERSCQRFDEAIEAFAELLRVVEARGQLSARSSAMANLGRAYYMAWQADGDLAHLERAKDILTKLTQEDPDEFEHAPKTLLVARSILVHIDEALASAPPPAREEPKPESRTVSAEEADRDEAATVRVSDPRPVDHLAPPSSSRDRVALGLLIAGGVALAGATAVSIAAGVRRPWYDHRYPGRATDEFLRPYDVGLGVTAALLGTSAIAMLVVGGIRARRSKRR